MVITWLKAIDDLIVEKGEKKNSYYRATVTSLEILQRIGAVVTVPNHRNVLKVVQRQYPDSVAETAVEGGWVFHIKIRSK